MKYAISLLCGLLAGAVLFAAGLYYNPFMGRPTVSPLAVTDDRVMDFTFSGVPANSILYTDHGETIVRPIPDRVAELWEPAVYDSSIFVTTLRDVRGAEAGVGIKFLSKAEETALIRGEALANSVWHIYLPGQGTMMIDQTENYFSYLREIVIPARLGSGDHWRGSYFSVMTSGPGSLGTARVSGGSGLFSGLSSESVESLSADGYSGKSGPVSMERTISVAIPQPAVAQE
jgi:hypothetical protein